MIKTFLMLLQIITFHLHSTNIKYFNFQIPIFVHHKNQVCFTLKENWIGKTTFLKFITFKFAIILILHDVENY